MGGVCNKVLDCFGTSSKDNNTANNGQNRQNNTNYHRLSNSPSNGAINANKGKKNSPVIYSSNQQQQSQGMNKSGSNPSLSRGNQQTDQSSSKKKNQESQENHYLDDEDEDDSQQRAIKKIDSQKYLLKHSNLSAILEEDEQHKDSLKILNRKHSREAKKIHYREGHDSHQNSILILQTVDYESHNPSVIGFNRFTAIHEEEIGENISTYLPNFEQMTQEAIENLTSTLNKDFIEDGYTIEHNQQEGENSNFYSQIYVKPAETDKYRYFKIRTEYNIYNCSAREYLRFTTDTEQSKANNSSIDDFIHVSCHNDYHIMYITYKKVLICSPRDFVYLKYNKQIDSNTYISVQFSIETTSYPAYQGKERGIIVLSGSLITEEVDNNGQKYIKLSNFAESNLKLTLAHKLMKSSTVKEVKKFILNMQDHFLKQGQQN